MTNAYLSAVRVWNGGTNQWFNIDNNRCQHSNWWDVTHGCTNIFTPAQNNWRIPAGSSVYIAVGAMKGELGCTCCPKTLTSDVGFTLQVQINGEVMIEKHVNFTELQAGNSASQFCNSTGWPSTLGTTWGIELINYIMPQFSCIVDCFILYDGTDKQQKIRFILTATNEAGLTLTTPPESDLWDFGTDKNGLGAPLTENEPSQWELLLHWLNENKLPVIIAGSAIAVSIPLISYLGRKR